MVPNCHHDLVGACLPQTQLIPNGAYRHDTLHNCFTSTRLDGQGLSFLGPAAPGKFIFTFWANFVVY